MKLSVGQVIHTLALKPHVKFKVVNTFFALTLSSYYVGVHHTPKIFRGFRDSILCETQSVSAEKTAQLQVSLHIYAPSFHPIASQKILSVVPEKAGNGGGSGGDGGELPLKITSSNINKLSFGGAEAFEEISKSDNPFYHPHGKGQTLLSNISHPQGFLQLAEGSSTPDRSFVFQYGFVNTPAGDMTPVIKPFIPGPPSPPDASPLNTNIDKPSKLSFNQDEEVLNKGPVINLSKKIGKRTQKEKSQGNEKTNQMNIPPVEVIQSGDKAPLTLKPLTANNTMRPWYTYILKSYNPILKNWLSRIAPSSKAIPLEIPFRTALVETLLSEQFQAFVNEDWADEADDAVIKMRRQKFCQEYMEKVDWSKTPFERLFLTPEKDWHQVNEDAYDYAYEFPLKLRVRAYRDEDFCERR